MGTAMQCETSANAKQFNSIKQIIPQGTILLWSWRARKKTKKQKHKLKRTIQQTQHHQQKSLTLTRV